MIVQDYPPPPLSKADDFQHLLLERLQGVKTGTVPSQRHLSALINLVKCPCLKTVAIQLSFYNQDPRRADISIQVMRYDRNSLTGDQEPTQQPHLPERAFGGGLTGE